MNRHHRLPPVLGLLALLFPAAPASAADWAIQVVDHGPFIGAAISMGLDPANQPHCAYYAGSTIVLETGTLRHARADGANWDLETVDAGASVGQYCSLLFDDQGRPMIAYYDNYEFNRDLKFAWWDAVGGWTKTWVDTTGATGQHACLAMRPDGALSISYFNVDGADLMVARSTVAGARQAGPPPGTWTTETLDVTGTVGQFTSILFNSLGGEVVTYYDASLGDLVSQRFLTGGLYWLRGVIDIPGDVGRYIDSVYDSWGYAHVSYYDLTAHKLKYAAGRLGRSWYTETVTAPGEVGRPSAIALTPAGNIEIAYRDDRGWLMLARKITAYQWLIEPIDMSGTVGEALDFAIDPTGRRHIFFYDSVNRRLCYATAQGEAAIVGVPEAPPIPAGPARLGANHPNPFNPVTWFPVSLSESGEVRLDVLDVTGRRVARVHEGSLAAGDHEIPFDGVDDEGRPLGSGIYFYRLTAGGGTQTRKMTLAR